MTFKSSETLYVYLLVEKGRQVAPHLIVDAHGIDALQLACPVLGLVIWDV